MVSNGHGNPQAMLTILYRIANSDSPDDALFNAFTMPRQGPKGPTLASIKQRGLALHGLNHLGPDGYHWRVCVEDKPLPGFDNSSGSKPTFSWWDIQDENAHLPVKEASSYDLYKFFAPAKKEDHSDYATKAAKGAFKSLGKAVTSAVSGHDGTESGGPLIPVVAFKLLDLVKMHDDFEHKHKGRPAGQIPQMPSPTPGVQQANPETAARRAPPRTQQSQPAPRTQPPPPPPNAGPLPRRAATQPVTQQQQHRAAAPQQHHEVNLMGDGFFDATQSGAASLLGGGGRRPAAPLNETRAERLQREYAQKKSTSNRVWDEIDQRWVDVDPKVANSSAGVSSRTGSATSAGSFGGGSSSSAGGSSKNVGISLDPSSAVGKSAAVSSAVNKRVNDMRQSQAKALGEIRQREDSKKASDAEEDVARKKLEPKIKAWSEEYGKKKQLRALLGSLHTILWPAADWKPVSIGDIMEPAKCKKCYHKASRVVHPDKTHHLDAEKRFLAKRIFDSLSQAKTEFDANGGR